MKLVTFVKQLEKFAPLNLAESWDNVGLLIEPTAATSVTKVLATIDLTEAVLNEAIRKKCDFLLSYHPPIFQSFKRLTQCCAKDRIIMKCIENSIAVYSPHTSWDSVANGVNDWLVKCFTYKNKVPITPNPNDPNEGMGRIITLVNPLPLTKVCDTLRSHLGVQHVRLAHADSTLWEMHHSESGNRYDLITTIAVCAGSGGSLLRGVDADLYITGEMSHHEVLAAVSEGRNVLLSEHTHTERGYLKCVVQELGKQIGEGVEFVVSEEDHSPLGIV